MTNDTYDLAIVGGGIGGGALATVMARAGHSVLLLEKSAVYRDLVRGEWMAPWGVVEAKRIGLYDDLIAAGGHHLSKHITYGDAIEPSEAEAGALPIAALVPDIPGPLCIGHPAHCELLHVLSLDAGATALRGVTEISVTLGAEPAVTYMHDGATHTARCRILVGADGRGSLVRRAAGIELHRDPTHHLFSGLLIEDAQGFPDDLQVLGAEGDVHYLAFPQGKGRIRLYLGFPAEQSNRFAGEKGPQAFLEAFRLETLPGSEHLANATPAGPCHSYPNEDAWTDTPYAQGMVLIGDAAGWNDPIIGQGLSITYRDVRIVSEILRAGDDWSPAAFAPCAEERRERMRRLRFSAKIVSTLLNEFGDEARARRARAFERQRANPMLALAQLAALIGPDAVPEIACSKRASASSCSRRDLGGARPGAPAAANNAARTLSPRRARC
jgi:2-polyprenyl-6-methoxyphenol hydroxylase-like FAD-dependent oxidoreductase